MIKQIPQAFNLYGANFRLIQRNEFAAVYERLKEEDGMRYVTYETHKIRTRPPHFENEKEFTVVEALCATSDFGTYGWTYGTIDRAMAKFHSVTDKEKFVLRDRVKPVSNDLTSEG